MGDLALVPVRAAGSPRVAVVLLVGAVVLQQLDAVLAEEVVAVAQLLGDLAAQVVAFDLDDFDGTEFWFVRHGGLAEGRAGGRPTWRVDRIVIMISIIVIYIAARSAIVNRL